MEVTNWFKVLNLIYRKPEKLSLCATHYWAHNPQLLKPTHALEPLLHKERSHYNENHPRCNKDSARAPQFSAVQFSRSLVSNSLRPHELQHARPPCPSPTPGVHSNSSIESVMPSSHCILCHPLFLLPPIPSSIRVFSNESTLCMKWLKYWSFSFGIIPSKEHPGLISFRMDWLDLLAVQGTLKSLL